MKYNIWINPQMPLPEEVEKGIVYIPQAQYEDERLTKLDQEVYFSLCLKEQRPEGGYKEISEIVKEIKTHPDKDDAILDEYLLQTGKTLDTLTNKEYKRIPKVSLTIEDIEQSLSKLVEYGYIQDA